MAAPDSSSAAHPVHRIDEHPVAAATSTVTLNTQKVGDKLIVNPVAEPQAVEQYRKLAATLHRVQVERGTRVVMISSAMAGEGKSLTAANLSLTLSESFRRSVLLVDADLRRPAIHNLFGVSNNSGLNNCLAAGRDVKLHLVKVSPHLTILPAGPPNADPMGGLASDRMRAIIEEASSKFEWVVLDTPPVGLLPDANLLAEMVDMILVVVRAGSTPYEQVRRAIAALDRNRIVGVVLNRVADRGGEQYYGYYMKSGGRDRH
jgi:capsular exopolysaccharide synthesis family protein